MNDNLFSHSRVVLFGVPFHGLGLSGYPLFNTATATKQEKGEEYKDSVKMTQKFLRDVCEAMTTPETGSALPLKVDGVWGPQTDNAFKAVKLANIYAYEYQGNVYVLPRPCVYLVKGDGREIVGEGNRLQTKLNTTSMLQWSLDRAEKTLRVQLESGPIEEILLDSMLTGELESSRAELASRAELSSRAELASRAELVSSNRIKR